MALTLWWKYCDAEITKWVCHLHGYTLLQGGCGRKCGRWQEHSPGGAHTRRARQWAWLCPAETLPAQARAGIGKNIQRRQWHPGIWRGGQSCEQDRWTRLLPYTLYLLSLHIVIFFLTRMPVMIQITTRACLQDGGLSSLWLISVLSGTWSRQ